MAARRAALYSGGDVTVATLRKYSLIYLEFLRTSFGAATSFRLHFVLVVVMDLLFYASSLLTVDFLYDHVAKIGPWGREQFLLFVSFMLAIDQLHMTFISENFWNFASDVRYGKLDFTLLKPVSPLFPSFLRYIRAPSLALLPVPWIAVIYYGQACGLSSVSWALLPVLVVAALAVQVSMEILITMVVFHTVEANGINFLRVQLQTLSRWPSFLFQLPVRVFFSVVLPVLLIGTPAVQFLFDPSDWKPLGWMALATVGQWVAIKFAWDFGVRRYESASS